MVNRTLDEFGAVDVLVNNAGIGGYAPFLQMTLREWDLNMAINLRAPFIACQAVAPLMIEQGGGSVINVSSHAATNIFSSTLGEDHDAGIAIIGQAYGAAKAGLERFTWGLAAELGPHNIAVNALKPLRPVATEGFRVPAPRRRFLHLGHAGGHGQGHRLPRRPGWTRPHRGHNHRRGTGAAAGVVDRCRLIFVIVRRCCG